MRESAVAHSVYEVTGMDTQTAEATLEDHLFQGIAKEIFITDKASALCAAIGDCANQVNSPASGQLFGFLQVA
jgi:hypothetical protein